MKRVGVYRREASVGLSKAKSCGAFHVHLNSLSQVVAAALFLDDLNNVKMLWRSSWLSAYVHAGKSCRW